MGKWLELFRTLKGGGIAPTPETPETPLGKPWVSGCDTVATPLRHLGEADLQASKGVAGVSHLETPDFPRGVSGVSGVGGKATSKSTLEDLNGSNYPAASSSI
jgi:hypothetical protein